MKSASYPRSRFVPFWTLTLTTLTAYPDQTYEIRELPKVPGYGNNPDHPSAVQGGPGWYLPGTRTTPLKSAG